MRVNQATGALTPLGGSGFGFGAYAVAFSPNGKFVADAYNGGSVTVFSVNYETGVLTEVPGGYAGANHPTSLAFSPDGSLLVTAAGNGLEVFRFNETTGELKEVAGSPFASLPGVGRSAVTFNAKGDLVAATNQNAGSVSLLSVNPTTGELTEEPSSPVAVTPVPNGEVTQPWSAAFSPSGDLLAIANFPNKHIGAVEVFSVNHATGGLSVLSNTPVAEPLEFPASLIAPSSLAFSRDGQQLATADYTEGYIYGLVGGAVSVFDVDQPTGTLTEVAGSPFSTPRFAASVAFSPIEDLLAEGNWVAPGSVSVFSGGVEPHATGAPEFGRCGKALPVKEGTKTVYHGGFTNSTCTKASTTIIGKYEWLPGPTKTGFTTAIKPGTHATFETVGKVKVTCTGETGSGAMSTKTVSHVVMTFTGCASGTKLCTTAGQVGGVLKTSALEGIFGWENKALAKIALDLQPAGGSGPVLEYTCTGSPATTLSGSVLVPVKGGKAATTATLKFAASKGKQKPEAFEGGAKDVLSNGKEQVGLALTAIQTNEEAIEIDPAA